MYYVKLTVKKTFENIVLQLPLLSFGSVGIFLLPKNKFSQVSALVYLLHTATIVPKNF
jgi:hypothetical protein